MKRHSHIFLLLCWLAYFAVPLVNAVGQTGAQRIEICTTLGVETYYVFAIEEADKDKASQHSSSHSCPCTHFFIDSATPALVALSPLKPIHLTMSPTNNLLAATPQIVQARAPPMQPALSTDLTLA
ncbi:DUF2946 family protein [Marinomonas ostreistagni]|uniref:DUF2946 family protein n=1 Tax=Marinomonas ostreistagni TaxID=359209 RepID=UPI001950B044|nr:DUF2946 family protein [Marinomonas ostreistagni]MBM6551552.1 hypothetical protein [Marinomonas ostreistagni]